MQMDTIAATRAIEDHRKPGDLSDGIALAITKFLRFFADTFFAKRYGNRAIVLDVPAPPVARHYWKLPANATLRDVVIAVRADEAEHRYVNHRLADGIARAG